MKVLKFGGTSVGSAENIEKVISIVKDQGACAVVLSAMSGTTDALIDIGRKAEGGDNGYRLKINDLKEKHLAAANGLLPETGNTEILEFIENAFSELENICEGVSLLRELSTRSLDRILSYGELISTRMVSAALTARGIDNAWKDSRELIRTDSNFGFATVDFEKTNRQIAEYFSTTLRTLYILPGFIASDDAGSTTTLGRGGSDYTAAIIAAGAGAESLEIWTDVSGMMTADPRFVKNVRQIPRITYREAMELSHFGAKVVYPPTIHPVMARGIPVWIKNTFAPGDHGTIIEMESAPDNEIIRGITSIDKICVLSLEGSGMVGIPSFSKRLFDALLLSQINVILITQSSSEHSICVAIEEKYAQTAKRVVDAEFEYEINVGKIDPLRVETGFSILALVGDNMKEHTGVSGRMFATLGHNGINIHAIAQGSSERNISTIINSTDARKAVNTLHEEFFSDGNKQINVYITGTGTVGSRLIEQIRQQHEYLLDNMRLNLRVVGLANSRKNLIKEDGLDLENWRDDLGRNATVMERAQSKINSEVRSPDFADLILDNNFRNSIFV
ncbi:MAG TPA: aspartate kinase, partial [Pyrinomonadaceae bacterium]|nr:aspartate kinase [Pyrinomonadaceae bacterium]